MSAPPGPTPFPQTSLAALRDRRRAPRHPDARQPSRQLTETSALGTLTSQYDLAGNRTRLDWPAAGGGYAQYTYDLLNRMDQVHENAATSGAGLLADYSCDTLGRPTSLARGNGAGTNWSYVANTRNWSMTQNLSGTTNDLTLAFILSPAPQVTERAISNPAYSFTPPTLSEAYTRDGLNRYKAVAGQAFTYDGRQNLTDDGPNTFAYDVENRLTAVSGASAMTLAYDPLGRLKQTVSDATTTRFLYGGDRLIGEYNAAETTVTARYAHGAGRPNFTPELCLRSGMRTRPRRDTVCSLTARHNGDKLSDG